MEPVLNTQSYSSFNPTTLLTLKSKFRNITYSNSMTMIIYCIQRNTAQAGWKEKESNSKSKALGGWCVGLLLSVYGRLQMCRSPGAQRRVAPHEPAFPERQRENGTGGGQDDYKCTEVALVKGCKKSIYINKYYLSIIIVIYIYNINYNN